MRKIIVLNLLCISACNNSTVIDRSDEKVDSMITDMRRHTEVDVINYDYGSSIKYLDSLGPYIKQFANQRAISSWYLLKGSMFMHQNKLDSSHYYAILAHRAAEQITLNTTYLINAKNLLIETFTGLKNYDSAISYGLQAYALSQKNDFYVFSEINSALSDAYSEVGDTLNRRKHLFEGYRYANNPHIKLVLANAIAKYYFDLGKMDSVKAFQAKVISDSIINKKAVNSIIFKSNIGILLSQEGRLKEGLFSFMDGLYLSRLQKIEDKRIYMNLYMNIAQNMASQNQISQSNKYIDSALHIAKENDNYIIIYICYRFLANNLMKTKNPVAAYAALDSSYTYFKRNDSLAFVEKLHELETSYSVKKKDEEIKTLAYSNDVNRRIRTQQQLINVTLAILLVSLVVLGILIFRRRQMKTRLRETELEQQVLHSQMNPHFLFNTLSALQGIIRSGNIDKAHEFILKLAKLLRLIFDNASMNLIPLTNELAFLENYLLLQKLQLEDRFDYRIEINVGPESDVINIPPMILQPFVENAIMHSFTNLTYQGQLSIRLTRIGNILHCLVEDNGTGLKTTIEGEKHRTHSIEVIKERLRLFSRNGNRIFPIKIVDKRSVGQGSGVIVHLEIPIFTNS